MPSVTRLDNATRGHQLAAYTTLTGDVTVPVRPWLADANGARTPVNGVVLQIDPAATPGSWIEYGGPDITSGNGLVLVAGAPAPDVLVPAPNAAAIWILASVAGIKVRAQVL